MNGTPAYFEPENGAIRCTLCPHRCLLRRGGSGICGVRRNVDGSLLLPYSGILSSVALDPIEKKPLYHFFPGSSVYSVGFFGCNLHCPFCQNYRISQQHPQPMGPTSVSEVVDGAKSSGAVGLAFTYSEPVIHAEYLLEAATAARAAGLKTVLVTNGFVSAEAAEDLLPHLDAANIDLKSFSDEFYKNELGGRLQPVLDFIQASTGRIHVEVTTLVIPGRTGSVEEIDAAAAFIAGVDRDIPYHLTGYYPRYRYKVRPTTAADLEPLVRAARARLRYVYATSSPGGSDTLCPACGGLVVERRGYRVRIAGLEGTRCGACGASLPFVRAPTT